MTDAEIPAPPRVLVARCDNYREDVDQACHGEIRFRWGMSQSDPCNVCGGRCGVAVAAWERVELAAPAVPTDAAEELARVMNDAANAQEMDVEPRAWEDYDDRMRSHFVAVAHRVLDAGYARGAVPDTGQAHKSLRYCEGCTHEADTWHDEDDGHCLIEGCRCDVLELPGHTIDCDTRYSNAACTCGQTITPGGGSVSAAASPSGDTGQASH